VRDLAAHEAELTERIGGASLLVLGGAGSIGRQVVKVLFPYQPARLHVCLLAAVLGRNRDCFIPGSGGKPQISVPGQRPCR
jgi:hypothetical protein